jgi:acetyl-CoA carboxylase carboxyl transferase subunit alpha
MGDRFLMMENTWYSVIAPESCSSILWRSWDYKEQAAEALRLTARDLVEMRIADAIIAEPIGGAHRDQAATARSLKAAVLSSLNEIMSIEMSQLLEERQARYALIGVWETGNGALPSR